MICNECGAAIPTTGLVWTVDDQPWCGECIRKVAPSMAREIALAEQMYEPGWERAHDAASRN